MDVEISITKTFAGISVGLVTHNDGKRNITKQQILTEIRGTEDHFRDMDFICFRTRNGITGVQLDLKIQRLPIEIAKAAIRQSKNTRMQFLEHLLDQGKRILNE
jgi:polyribonucleotide nucleotidyltransferase